MKINKNTQKIIDALRSHGVKTLNAIMTKTSFSEIIVLSELKQLIEGNLAEVCQGHKLLTYKLSKNRSNCCWSAHLPGSDFWFCIHPDVPETSDGGTPCRNDKTCAKHRFLDEEEEG